jgi:GAF domain-containing protein
MEARTYTSTLEESAIIERVARIVFSVRGTKPDYTRLAAELEQAVPFDIFGVVLLRHDRQAVRVIVCQRDANGWFAVPHQHPLADSMLEQVLQAPVLSTHDYPAGLDGAPAVSGDALSSYHQLRSTLIAPLVVEDRVLGTLELGSTALHTYADVSLQRLLSAVVRVLAAAIESVQLGGNAAIQDRQRQALKDVTSALTSKDLSTILDQITSGVANALHVPSCIVLVDRHEGILRLAAQSGLESVAAKRIFSHNLRVNEKCIISQTLLQQQPLMSHDIANDENYPESNVFFSELGLHSIFCYPLVANMTAYGVLMACSTEPGGFTPLKADILALFANQATVAIHNGMLLESVHQRSRFQEAVEQLELAHLERQSADRRTSIERQEDELALLKRVREETENTFGVSFTSLLRLISDNLLTQNERDLQAVFYVLQNQSPGLTKLSAEVEAQQSTRITRNVAEQDRKDPFAKTAALLEQTSEAALYT